MVRTLWLSAEPLAASATALNAEVNDGIAEKTKVEKKLGWAIVGLGELTCERDFACVRKLQAL